MKKQKIDYSAIIIIGIGLLVFAAMIFLSGCSPQMFCPKHGYELKGGDTIRQIDSVVYHDSVVKYEFQADSSSLLALIDCREGQAHLMQILSYKPGNNVAPPKVEIRDNILYVNCNVREWEAFVKVRSSEVYRDVYKAKVYVKITNILTGWQSFQLWTGRFALIVLLIFVGVKYGWPLIRKAFLKV